MSKDMRYTPGSWLYVNGSPTVLTFDGPVAMPVCKVERCLREDANARLIASAPELLEALKSILWRAMKGDGSPALLNMIQQDCEIAIEKAQGGAK